MFSLGVDHLTVSTVIDLIQGQACHISGQSYDQIASSAAVVDDIVAKERAVYGINTGFGPLCDTRISIPETTALQRNILLSHAAGVGPPISKDLSKVMLLTKMHALCQGYSGVRPELVDRLMYLYKRDLIPVVPSQGSVGASGDLAPLAHLCLPLIGLGYIWQDGQQVPSKELLSHQGREPIQLEAKEGLALINGTQFILAHAVLGLHRMSYLLDLADLAGVMSLEAFRGSASPFRADLHALRPFSGSVEVATRIRHFLKGSENLAIHDNCGRVQDPYSLRCMPQVHGASRNAFDHLMSLVDIELNAVTDNPIIVDHDAISGGNFHGQPLAMAIDYMALATSELGNIADRRIYLLLEGKYGLPRLLINHQGLHSGMMIAQYTSAALASENKALCYPASADSIPTSLGQEDHVSMGSIAGRKWHQILDHIERILAIELLVAAQGLDFRRPARCSTPIEHAHQLIRESVPHMSEDRLLYEDINAILDIIQHRKIDVSCTT